MKSSTSLRYAPSRLDAELDPETEPSEFETELLESEPLSELDCELCELVLLAQPAASTQHSEVTMMFRMQKFMRPPARCLRSVSERPNEPHPTRIHAPTAKGF